jgi:hypothetical protein
MIMKRKFVVVVFILALIISSASFADVNEQDNDETIINFGCPSDILLRMDTEKKATLARAIKENPNNVQMELIVAEIDEVSTIEKIVNTSDEKLLEDGFSKEDIQKMRKHIEKFLKLSDEEAKKKYKNRTAEEINLWRKAAKKQKNYKPEKKLKDKVTTSGTISSSKLTYNQFVCDISSTIGKPVGYLVVIGINWNQSYFWDIFKDQIGIGWGGNLATQNIDHDVWYTSGNQYSWNDVNEGPINAGLKFKTWQATLDPYYSQIDMGIVSTELYQNQKQNYDTKVLSAYGHKIIVWAGAGISVSASGPSVSLSFSTGYDYTPQASSSITY